MYMHNCKNTNRNLSSGCRRGLPAKLFVYPDYASHRFDGALCVGEVAHIGSRVPPSTDGGLDVKFVSRAVQQVVRGQYCRQG